MTVPSFVVPGARRFAAALFFALLTAAPVVADEPPPTEIPEPGTSRDEVLRALQEVQSKWGSDAVLLQGQLLGNAVRGGSVLTAEIAVDGIEERAGKRFLTYKLDTGIVFNDREVPAAARPAQVWLDIVDTSFRDLHRLAVPADGIALRLRYTHREYATDRDVRRELQDQPGQPETIACFMTVRDLEDFGAKRVSSQELSDRSTILLDGTPTRLAVPTRPPSPRATP